MGRNASHRPKESCTTTSDDVHGIRRMLRPSASTAGPETADPWGPRKENIFEDMRFLESILAVTKRTPLDTPTSNQPLPTVIRASIALGEREESREACAFAVASIASTSICTADSDSAARIIFWALPALFGGSFFPKKESTSSYDPIDEYSSPEEPNSSS